MLFFSTLPSFASCPVLLSVPGASSRALADDESFASEVEDVEVDEEVEDEGGTGGGITGIAFVLRWRDLEGREEEEDANDASNVDGKG